MDLARMRPGDYPALPEAWQVAAGPGDLRYGVQARRYEYMNAQCRYCGSGCGEPGPVGAHPRALCLACGTPQCESLSGKCLVCLAGWLRTSFWGAHGRRSACGYTGCDGQAVADAPRVRQVCLADLGRATAMIRGARITLADSIGASLLQRDRGGQDWQKIAWFGPPKRYYVRRYQAVAEGGGHEGWVGPISTAGQADREAQCWRESGYTAERWEATPEVTERVSAWQAAADARLGRPAQARARQL